MNSFFCCMRAWLEMYQGLQLLVGVNIKEYSIRNLRIYMEIASKQTSLSKIPQLKNQVQKVHYTFD